MSVRLFGYASVLALLSTGSAQTSSPYPANTNTNCVTSSDIAYQGVYYYSPTDTMDWGFYTQSQGTCDPGSYARVRVVDPSGNDIDCGYTPLDGQLHLTSCINYPRGYMQEGQYTMYWETIPGASQYSWNQFIVSHSQSTVTAATPTQTVTTTPVIVLTTTLTSTSTTTQFIQQSTITTPSATMTNVINITPLPTTITTTSISWYSLTAKQYTQSTLTAVTTATCTRAPITPDKTGSRKTSSSSTSGSKTGFNWWWSRSDMFSWLFNARRLRVRDGDVPNTAGVIGSPLTTTITPDAVIQTITAATSTTTITSVINAPAVTVTSQNPTPTLTMYSGVAVQTITTTLPQSTKSVIKTKASVTVVTSVITLTYTKNVKTTPVCAPTAI